MKVIKSFNPLIGFTVVLMLLSLTACVSIATASNLDIKTFLATHENNIKKSTQVLIVIDNNSPFPNQRKVYALEKKGGEWRPAFEPFDAVIGKNGFAAAGKKREGDGKTPSGAFLLQMTFGYDKSINTKMPYHQALFDDIWVDDPKANDYNRWVKKSEALDISYEIMRRDDNLYKYGIVIEYNTNPVVKGYGSAIFFHVWRGKDIPTSGCVAVSEQNIVKILAWLDPKALPVIIMGKDNTPEGFVDIKKVIPEAVLDIRYYSPHNFLGEKVDGYMAPKCLLTKETVDALAKVQKELAPFSLSLKIYDCYRPQRAVNHFVRWAKDINNSKTKKEFYPTVDKRNLFKKIKDWVLDAKGKVRKSLVRQHIITNLDIHNKNIIRVKNGSPYIFRKSCVLLLKTSFAKWNSVLKDIQKTATPFIPGEHLEEDIDLQDTFFRSDALSRVGLQLSKELKNKQRRLWCEDFNLECQSVIKQLMSEEEARLKRIQTAKEKAKKRDKKRCQVTGVHRDKYNNVTVEAHHLYCASIFPHLADLEDNLITLDSTIHQDFHAFMGGTQVPCTVDDFLLFLHENHPDSTQRLGVYLERVKRIFNDPQIPEDS